MSGVTLMSSPETVPSFTPVLSVLWLTSGAELVIVIFLLVASQPRVIPVPATKSTAPVSVPPPSFSELFTLIGLQVLEFVVYEGAAQVPSSLKNLVL